jgi:hypothetical protein
MEGEQRLTVVSDWSPEKPLFVWAPAHPGGRAAFAPDGPGPDQAVCDPGWVQLFKEQG